MEELSVTEFDREIETLKLPPLAIFKPDASVFEVIRYFKDNTQGLVGIGDGGKLSGIVSEWDIIHQFSPKVDPTDIQISDLMIENPVILYSENTLYEVMKVMGRRNFSSFPVCDENGSPKYIFNTMCLFDFITSYFKKFLGELGTVEEWDPNKSIQTFSEDFNYSATMDDDSSLHQNYFLTPFDRIPSTKLHKVEESLSIDEAWQEMVEHNIEALVVTQYGTKLKGILTLRDLISKVLIHKGETDLSLPISEVMTEKPHSLMYKHAVGYGINHFMRYQYRHMIVVDEDRIPLKVVSLLEVFAHLIGKIKLN